MVVNNQHKLKLSNIKGGNMKWIKRLLKGTKAFLKERLNDKRFYVAWILFVAALTVYFTIIDLWEAKVLEIFQKPIFKNLFVLFSDNGMCIVSILGIIGFCWYLIVSIRKSVFSRLRFVVTLFLFIIVLFERRVEFAPLFGWEEGYRYIVLSPLCLCILFEVWKCFKYIEHVEKCAKISPQGGLFTSNSIENHSIETGREEFAGQLATMVKNTKVFEESYALGIVGDWGSGKSAFLHKLKEFLQE